MSREHEADFPAILAAKIVAVAQDLELCNPDGTQVLTHTLPHCMDRRFTVL